MLTAFEYALTNEKLRLELAIAVNGALWQHAVCGPAQDRYEGHVRRRITRGKPKFVEARCAQRY
jgi:hypothetical protein